MNSIGGYKESLAFFNSFAKKCNISKLADITSTVSYVFARLSQFFSLTSCEKQWELYSKKINEFSFSVSNQFNVTFQKVNASLFLRLSNKKFTSLIRSGAALYFQQKISNGEETLESVNKKFKSKSESLSELFRDLGVKEICSTIGLQDLVKFIERSPIQKEWRNFELVIHRYVSSKAIRLLEKCQNKFISIFQPKDLSWKIFLGKQLVDVTSEAMPAFAKDFLGKLKEGLPNGYREKVLLFRAAKKAIINVVEKKISDVRFRVFQGLPILILERPSIDKTEHEFITDVAESCIDFKYTEHFPIKPTGVGAEGFELKYQGDIIIAKIIRDCFHVYKDRISEDDFHEAYKKWNRIEADPKALDRLIEKKIVEVREKASLDNLG